MTPQQSETISLNEADQALAEVQTRLRKLKSYADYEYSGVEWLGEIPEHWQVRKLKFLADIKTSNVDKKSIENEEDVLLCNYVDVYYNDYIKSDINFMKATASHEEIKKFEIKHGDVLITKDSEAWDDIAIPAFVDEDIDGVLCGYHLAQIRPYKDVCGEYLFRAFGAHSIQDQFRVRANGITRFGISRDGITSAIFPVPAFDEQKTIAAFLRKETSKIDSLVAKKRKLIELLGEKRTALISHAVTKGLNPDVKLKSSGIDWLDDIPEHWEVRRLKNLVSMKSGDNITAESIDVVGEYPVYGGNGLRGYTNSFTHNGRHILVGRQGALCGNVHLVEGVFWASEHCAVATCNEYVFPEWCSYLIEVMNLKRYSETAAQPGLSVERVLRLPVPFTSLDEQEQIASYLKQETNFIDRLILKIESAIEKLTEYRSALISAAVTGKIDVTGI